MCLLLHISPCSSCWLIPPGITSKVRLPKSTEILTIIPSFLLTQSRLCSTPGGLCRRDVVGSAVAEQSQDAKAPHASVLGNPLPHLCCFHRLLSPPAAVTVLRKTQRLLVQVLVTAASESCPTWTVLPSFVLFSFCRALISHFLGHLTDLDFGGGGCICISEQQVTKEKQRWELGVHLSLLPAKSLI